MSTRIVQISFGDGYSGSARIAILSSKLLSQTDYKVTLFTSKNSLTESRAVEEGVNTKSFDTARYSKILFNEVKRIVEDIKPEVIISHHSLDRKIAMKLKRKSEIDFVSIAYRHNVTKSAPIIGAILYNIYFDFLIACSKGVAESLISSGISKNKVCVVYNGIDIPENIDLIEGKSIREKFDLKGKIILGLSTWFHKERKGFDILFKTFSELDERFVLLLVGIPLEEKKNVLEYANEFGIVEDRIIFPGYVENIWENYKSMDIFLLPSRSEGFSLSLLEAAAAELPIIASNIPGTNELISDGENGLLFDLENPDMLRSSILKLADNESIARKLAKSAKEIVNTNFTQQNYLTNLDVFLKRSLSNSRSSQT